MSFAIDVNILLYASDAKSALHQRATGFLERCVFDRALFCLAWPTVMGYLRMATHPSIFERPLTHDEARQNIESLLGLPFCRPLGEEDGFWDVYRGVTREVPTRGNLVPDAHLATILRQHDVETLYTHDRDFKKFDFLKVKDPLVEGR